MIKKNVPKPQSPAKEAAAKKPAAETIKDAAEKACAAAPAPKTKP